MVLQEPGTTNWFALKLGPAQFALFARVEELFADPPRIEQGEILASKTPRI
jgi:hypothetical protein